MKNLNELKAHKYCLNEKNLTKKHKDDAGLDIMADGYFTIPARGSQIVSTGLYVAIPRGCVGLIWSRSGMSINNKIEVGAGCLDAGYRNEVMVHLYNFSDEDYDIIPGQRIAQLLTIPVFLGVYQKVDDLGWEQLCDTERGMGGFGSTGK